MTLLILYLAIAIGVSFVCSVLEAVFLSITPSFTENLASRSPRAGGVVKRIRARLDESLSSILILNTFAHTMGAAGVGAQALQVFGARWEVPIAVVLTLAILYFSEIIPKTLGAVYWRPLAVPAAYTIAWLVKLVYPLVWLATRITRLFNRKRKNEITREEIIAMASLGLRGGNLGSQEIEYLANALRLREITTEQVLTPRTVVHFIDQDTRVRDALDMPLTKKFSRIPIYWENIDNITGKVLRNDLYEAERAGRGDEPVVNVAKEITRVSEKLPVQHLLDRFIKNRAHLFLVEDEYGQNAGIVTLEDAIETLLGREIVDESDLAEDMQALARNKYRERLRSIETQETQDDEPASTNGK